MDAQDSCPGDVCQCIIGDATYEVQQGRVQLNDGSTADINKVNLGGPPPPVVGGFGACLSFLFLFSPSTFAFTKVDDVEGTSQ